VAEAVSLPFDAPGLISRGGSPAVSRRYQPCPRLWHEQGRTTDARALLMPVYDRFVVADYFQSGLSEYDGNYVFVELDYLQLKGY